MISWVNSNIATGADSDPIDDIMIMERMQLA